MAEGNQHMAGSSSAHLFAPIQAPKLKNISRKSIQVFLAEREHYESAIGAQPGLVPISWLGCIDAIFLRSLVRARVFGTDYIEVSQLTDQVIKARLEELAVGSKSVSSDEAMADVRRNVKLDASEPDARLRILMLQTAYVELCERRGWNFVEKAPKAAVKHIVSVLQPQALKARIEDALQLEKHELKEDFFGFTEFLAEEAEVCEKFQPLRIYRATAKSQNGKEKREGPASGLKTYSSEKSSSLVSGSKDKRRNDKMLPQCLNPDCDERHWLKNCPITPEARRKSLIEAHHEKKKQKNQVGFRAGALMKQTSTSPYKPKPSRSAEESIKKSALMTAEIQGHTVSCRIDSGADDVVISDTIVRYLADNEIFLPSMFPSKELIFKSIDGSDVSASGQVQLNPTLRTVAGPCRLRNVVAYIVPCKETVVHPDASCPGELVLGNPFLIRSGLDVTDFISENIDRLSNIDYGTATSEHQGKIGKLGETILWGLKDTSFSENPRLYALTFNGDFPLTDFDDIGYKDVEVGSFDKNELDNEISTMIKCAQKQLPVEHRDAIFNLVMEFRDCFRVSLGNDPPVKVPPMKIEFEGAERPIKVRQRTYSPEQLEFLKKKCDQLLQAGFIYRNPSSKWACAPLIVPKNNEEGFRFTVDLRPVNAQTKRNVWPMPHPDQMVVRVNGSKVYFELDFIHGYWQFPLSPCSQECQSFHTPFGVYTPNRVQHGSTNSVSYFQSSMESMFGHLPVNIWLDDILGYAENILSLFDTLRLTLEVCRDYGLKLHPSKCELFTRSAQFCGRIIDSNGVRFNPANYEALTHMQPPTTVGALMELVHGASWMRSAIPQFSLLIDPLHALLESHYRECNTRKKSRLHNRPLSAWEDRHQDAFSSLIRSIIKQVTLSTPDHEKRTCRFTDASSTHWAGVLTQVDPAEVKSCTASPQEWNHAPVAFVSGAFRGSSIRWTTPEKECHAIVSSVTRLSHILATCGEFSLFTDHKNILYMLSPTRFNSNCARHIVHKTQRWALRLAEFHFTVEHIMGDHNLWADLLTRWAAPGNGKFPARRISALRVPLITKDMPTLPSLEAVAKSQKKAPPLENGFVISNESSIDVLTNLSGQLYIPADDQEIQLRICVAAHCGLGGHRGVSATLKTVKGYATWPTLDADVKAFVQGCLVCLLSETGVKVTRPLGNQLHASHVGELLHFDYLYIGPSSTGMEYILILKDDFSGYVFLRPCSHADSDTVADILMEYFSIFAPFLQWFSDQGPHFCNSVMENLASSMGVKHGFSTVYTPWANGTVEVVCKEVLRSIRAISTEFQVPEADWHKVVRSVQSVINNSPSRRLGGRAPITVHTGMVPGNPLSIALSTFQITEARNVDEAAVLQKLQVDKVMSALDMMHKEVSESLTKTRQQALERHNRKTHVRPYSPTVGDFVLVARMSGPRTKVSCNWVGPRRITKILSDFTVEVEHLFTNATSVLHICRVKPYVESSFGSKADMQAIADFTDRVWFTVDRIKDLREENGEYQLLVSWKGLTESGDSWEPWSVMFEDVPSLVRSYFEQKRNTTLLRKAKDSINL